MQEALEEKNNKPEAAGSLSEKQKTPEQLVRLEKQRAEFEQERELIAAVRLKNKPLWQQKKEQLPENIREKFEQVLTEVIDKEEGTVLEVAQEEANKMHEDIEDLVRDKEAENYAVACAEVFAKRTYQLKGQERIEKEEFVRPYLLLIEKEIKGNNFISAKEIIKNLPPKEKEICAQVPDIIDDLLERQEKKLIRDGDEEKLAELMAVRDIISNQFDLKNLEKLSAEQRQSPVFIRAAQKFLQNKLRNITDLFCAAKIKEYIWIREGIEESGMMSGAEVDATPGIKLQLKAMVIGNEKEWQSFFTDHIERYQYLKLQLEMAGIFKKDEIDQDRGTKKILQTILNNALEADENISKEDAFNRYLQARERMAGFGMMEKEEMDWNLNSQEKFQQLLFKQFSAAGSNEERLGKFFAMYEKMIRENMFPPEELKKIKRNPELAESIKTNFLGAVEENMGSRRAEVSAYFREKISGTDIISEEVVDSWKIAEGISLGKKAAA